MVKAGTAAVTIRQFQTLRVGGTFIDHMGEAVEKIGEFDVMIGVGYNSMSIADYLGMVRDDSRYGSRLVNDPDSTLVEMREWNYPFWN